MHQAVEETAAICHARTMCLLRSRRYHSVPELMLLFKSHVLSFAEYRAPALARVCAATLSVLDAVQD
eukprot:9453282-Pyramimonas_sp.AAC.1